MRPSKCPVCKSSQIMVTGTCFYCKKCHFINKQNPIVIRRK